MNHFLFSHVKLILRQTSFVFFLATVADTSFAQTTRFNKRLDFNPSNFDLAENLVSVKGGYMISGYTVDSTTGNYDRITFGFVDSIGHFNWRKSYGRNGYYYDPGGPEALIPTNDSNFVQVGWVYHDTVTWDDIYLMKLNKQGDTIWTKQYVDSMDSFGASCKQTKDKGFIIIGNLGRRSTNWTSEMLLMKTDSAGNLQWEKTYAIPGTEQVAFSIDFCQDHGFIIGGGSKTQAYLLKTDSLGNLSWRYAYGNSPYYVDGAGVIATSDGNFIFGSGFSENHIGTNYYDRDYIVKVASNGSQIWAKKYGPARIATGTGIIHELPDGSFVSVGQMADSSNTHIFGTLLKINSLGDSVWLREYDILKGFHSQNYLVDFKPTNDSGFVAVGFGIPSAPDTGNEDSWIIKVDKYGCDSAGCQNIVSNTGIKEFASDKNSFTIYPNPSNGYFTVDYHIMTGKPALMTIFDATGKQTRKVLLPGDQQRIEIDSSDLTAGLYFCSVITDGVCLGSMKLSILK